VPVLVRNLLAKLYYAKAIRKSARKPASTIAPTSLHPHPWVSRAESVVLLAALLLV